MATVTTVTETEERAACPELKRAAVRPRSLNPFDGAILKTSSRQISRPPQRFGFGDSDLQFEEVEDVRSVAYRTNLHKAKDTLSKNQAEEGFDMRSREMTPVGVESHVSNLLTWDMEPIEPINPITSTINTEGDSPLGSEDPEVFSRPLTPLEADHSSMVGYEMETPNLPSRDGKLSDESLGFTAEETSAVTPPGRGNAGFSWHGTGERVLTSPGRGETQSPLQPALGFELPKLRSALKFQDKSSGLVRNPKVHFARQVVKWTPSNSDEASYSSSFPTRSGTRNSQGEFSLEGDTFFERGAESPRNYPYQPNRDGYPHSSIVSSALSMATNMRRDTNNLVSFIKSKGNSLNFGGDPPQDGGGRPPQGGGCPPSGRGGYQPNGGGGHQPYGGGGYPPSGGRGHPPSGGGGYPPNSPGGGSGPPTGGAGRPSPGDQGGQPAGGRGSPWSGFQFGGDLPRQNLPNLTGMAYHTGAHGPPAPYSIQPTALAIHWAKDHVKIFRGTRRPSEVHFTPGPTILDWLASVESFYLITGIKDDPTMITYLPHFTDPHSGNAQELVGLICEEFGDYSYEEVKNILIDSYSKENAINFVELCVQTIGNQAPITSPEDVMERLIIMRRHVKRLSESYLNLPRYRHWSSPKKGQIQELLVEYNFFLLSAALFPRPIVERILFSEENARRDSRQLCLFINQNITRQHTPMEVEKWSRRHHQHETTFLGVEMGGNPRMQHRGFNRINLVAEAALPEEGDYLDAQPSDLEYIEDFTRAGTSQAEADMITQAKKKNQTQAQKSYVCALCFKNNHLHRNCRHKPAGAGKDNSCLICGGNNHRAVDHYAKAIRKDPGPHGPGVTCTTCQGFRHDAQHCPGTKGSLDLRPSST